jgi:N-formylmaleamate deformylase
MSDLVRPMHTWDIGFVDSHGARLKFFRSGGSLPPLVLVHGFTDSALYFSRLAEHLAHRWDVVAYDARGHGESSRLRESGGQFTDDIRVADLVQVVNTLQLDRPALIGHSMGGATIAAALAQHPQLSRGAVLEDPAWWELDDSQLEARRAARAQQVIAWTEWVTALQKMNNDDAISLRASEEPNWHSLDIETSVYARRHFDLDLFVPFLPERSPWRQRVAAFEVPVLLLLGSRSDRGAIITTDLANEAARRNPLLTWHVVPNAGHHLRYDNFDEFVRITDQFLLI